MTERRPPGVPTQWRRLQERRGGGKRISQPQFPNTRLAAENSDRSGELAVHLAYVAGQDGGLMVTSVCRFARMASPVITLCNRRESRRRHLCMERHGRPAAVRDMTSGPVETPLRFIRPVHGPAPGWFAGR